MPRSIFETRELNNSTLYAFDACPAMSAGTPMKAHHPLAARSVIVPNSPVKWEN